MTLFETFSKTLASRVTQEVRVVGDQRQGDAGHKTPLYRNVRSKSWKIVSTKNLGK